MAGSCATLRAMPETGMIRVSKSLTRSLKEEEPHPHPPEPRSKGFKKDQVTTALESDHGGRLQHSVLSWTALEG